jgi:single-strand DNA-binding protein
MSSFMSKQIIVGNLGRDPEMRYTPEGQPVTEFSVAVNRQYTSRAGEKIQDVVWFKITTWGKQAEVCNQYLHKGSKVLVEGRLGYDRNTGGPRAWNDKNTGEAKSAFELIALEVRFLDSKNNGGEASIPGNAGPGASEDEQDIPF